MGSGWKERQQDVSMAAGLLQSWRRQRPGQGEGSAAQWTAQTEPQETIEALAGPLEVPSSPWRLVGMARLVQEEVEVQIPGEGSQVLGRNLSSELLLRGRSWCVLSC